MSYFTAPTRASGRGLGKAFNDLDDAIDTAFQAAEADLDVTDSSSSVTAPSGTSAVLKKLFKTTAGLVTLHAEIDITANNTTTYLQLPTNHIPSQGLLLFGGRYVSPLLVYNELIYVNPTTGDLSRLQTYLYTGAPQSLVSVPVSNGDKIYINGAWYV